MNKLDFCIIRIFIENEIKMILINITFAGSINHFLNTNSKC